MSKNRGRKAASAAGRRINEAEFTAVQAVLRAARINWRDAPAKAPGTQALAGKVAQTVGFRQDHVLAMMERTGIGSSARPVLTSQAIERFLGQLRGTRVTYPDTRLVGEALSVRGGVADAPLSVISPSAGPSNGTDHTGAVSGYAVTAGQMKAVRGLLRECMLGPSNYPALVPEVVRELAAVLQLPEQAVAALLEASGLVHPLRTTTTPQRIDAFVAALRGPRVEPAGGDLPAVFGRLYPACQRLGTGPSRAGAAHVTATYYLALAELATDQGDVRTRVIAEIAADRFGISVDAAAGEKLQQRARRIHKDRKAAAQLEHLSRLHRRIRGVLYDEHRDRVIAWDSSSGEMLLYSCPGAELRVAAAAAVTRGHLSLPRMRRQAIGASYRPTDPTDPALVLAVVAEQLGRQATQALHPASQSRSQGAPQASATPLTDGYGGPVVRTISAAAWVQPVTGYWGQLQIGRLDSSYTRPGPWPLSRAASRVREHRRRAPGSSKDAAPTITVRSHPRRGIGPATIKPVTTRVSRQDDLWT